MGLTSTGEWDLLSVAGLEEHLAEHRAGGAVRLRRLWDYYRNELAEGEGGRLVTPQQGGLPARRRGRGGCGGGGEAVERERVVENDIAWRLHALVDFAFGREPALQCVGAGAGEAQRERLAAFLRAAIERAGGAAFYHDLGLLGSVYGFVDVLVRVDESRAAALGAGTSPERLAEAFTLELVDGPRALPVTEPGDYRALAAYAAHVERAARVPRRGGLLGRTSAWPGRPERERVEETEAWDARRYARFVLRGGRRVLVESGANRLGRVPVVHIQNLPQPFRYAGLSEVEPLIPLQDELNTRLSDRANRVTFQSFKMYLGRGIEGFTERPVGPGQMWGTDNAEASIQEFGGDAACPSESEHIAEVREAMDKASGVTPLAAGILRDRVGNLTSENALRVTMLGLLAKTRKKRATYGAGIARVCELLLHAADVYGLLPSDPAERRVRLDWPDPLPVSETQALIDAQRKLDVGVSRDQVLLELGYGDCPAAPSPNQP